MQERGVSVEDFGGKGEVLVGAGHQPQEDSKKGGNAGARVQHAEEQAALPGRCWRCIHGQHALLSALLQTT